MFDSLKNTIRRGGGSSSSASASAALSSLPVYSPLAADTFPPSPTTSDSHSVLKPAQRHATSSSSSSSPCKNNSSSSSSFYARPSLTRFLADFTLGFADGLTVPFALTAGLSSLGQTETVIYAGMAEICAGSISMGIGGYLSAKGDLAAASALDAGSEPACESESLSTAVADPESQGCVSSRDEKRGGEGSLREKTALGAADTAVDSYLAPLDLPRELLEMVRDHVSSRHDVASAVQKKLAAAVSCNDNENDSNSDQDDDDNDDDDDDDAPTHPVVSGFSVALGYLIGGSLPLFPYFLVSRVGDGLLWSFVVCIVALFTFGFIKDFALHLHMQRQRAAATAAKDWVMQGHHGGHGVDGRARWQWQWKDVRRSSWEGAQMVILGSLAAAAAVLCVRLFDGMGYAEAAEP